MIHEAMQSFHLGEEGGGLFVYFAGAVGRAGLPGAGEACYLVEVRQCRFGRDSSADVLLVCKGTATVEQAWVDVDAHNLVRARVTVTPNVAQDAATGFCCTV